jgi:prenyltransferase beta subunit
VPRPERFRRYVRASLAVLCAALAGALLSGPATAAVTPDGANGARLDATVRYLQEAQNLDGGFSLAPGGNSGPIASSWAAIALAAAGINPQDQRRPGGTDVLTFLRAHVDELRKTTDYERTLLAVIAAGADGRDFGGLDLVEKILAARLPSGAIAAEPEDTTGYINSTAFGILALSQVKGSEVEAALSDAADWLVDHQNDNGSWPSFALGTQQDADMTAAVLEALAAAGRKRTAAQQAGLAFLRTMQNDDGGFGANFPGDESNSATTSWVVQGLWASGEQPEKWSRSGGNPLTFLASMQKEDGSIRWKASDDANSVWMTTYAAPAYAGRPLPLTFVPPGEDPIDPPTGPSDPGNPPVTQPEHTGQPGSGGPGGGGKVLAGGGGDGAPLFVGPQPQSRGEQRLGARRVEPQQNKKHSSQPVSPPAPMSLAGPAPPGQAQLTSATPTGGSDQSGAGGAGGAGSGTGGGGPGGTGVTGRLIGGTGAAGSEDGAPSLRFADPGGPSSPAVLYGFLGALLIAAALGIRVERVGRMRQAAQ